MKPTLNCDFTIESQRGPLFWWPLVFEAMRQCSFSFTLPDPTLNKGMGQYSSHPRGGSTTGALALRPFKALWDEIYSEQEEGLMVWFWSESGEPAHLRVAITRPSDHNAVYISVMADGVETIELSTEEMKKYLQVVLTCAHTLYELCKPCIGEIYWDDMGVQYAAWATLGKFPGAPSSERPEMTGPERKLIRYYMPDEQYVHVLDPVPVPRKDGWEWISLVE